MGQGTPLTTDEQREIFRLATDHYSVPSIAIHLGITEACVYRHLRLAGFSASGGAATVREKLQYPGVKRTAGMIATEVMDDTELEIGVIRKHNGPIGATSHYGIPVRATPHKEPMPKPKFAYGESQHAQYVIRVARDIQATTRWIARMKFGVKEEWSAKDLDPAVAIGHAGRMHQVVLALLRERIALPSLQAEWGKVKEEL